MSEGPVGYPMLGGRARIKRVHLANFLSYREASLDLGDFVALVGPNASGKSNAVTALKLLREIPLYGLPTAIARRGGFDQLRHRGHGHSYEPGLRIEFQLTPESPDSFYELRLRALPGKRYTVRLEHGDLWMGSDRHTFRNEDGATTITEVVEPTEETFASTLTRTYRLPQGHSVTTTSPSPGSFIMGQLLSSIRVVEINPARVADLQDPSSTEEFEPDGSNAASMYEELDAAARTRLLEELEAIVPGIDRVEVRRLADKVTLAFLQRAGSAGRREFLAKQMSDGTLRAFSILLALAQARSASLVVIEEPEIAIHISALRTMVDILMQQAGGTQILITTHSADIVDSLQLDSIRVVWSEDGSSHISPVADHMREPIRKGLATPGELMRSDALDPALR